MIKDLLLRKMEKHKCLFRRLLLMGPSNLSLAILRRCTVPRQDYHLRVHRPEATTRLAETFEDHVQQVLKKWCGADTQALQLAVLPQKLGGLGLISSTLKQKYYFETARRSIVEHPKPNNAPVGIKGGDKVHANGQSRSEVAQKLLKKQMKEEHENEGLRATEEFAIGACNETHYGEQLASRKHEQLYQSLFISIHTHDAVRDQFTSSSCQSHMPWMLHPRIPIQHHSTCCRLLSLLWYELHTQAFPQSSATYQSYVPKQVFRTSLNRAFTPHITAPNVNAPSPPT